MYMYVASQIDFCPLFSSDGIKGCQYDCSVFFTISLSLITALVAIH